MKMDQNTAYKTVNGRYGSLTVFANDTGAATQSLLTYGEWAENEITFLQRFVTSGSTVLDVGAYIGTHTLALVHFAGPKGHVIAIEAQPDTFDVLKENVERNVPASLGCSVELKNAIASCELGQHSIPAIDIQRESSFGSASLGDVLTGALPNSVTNEAVRQAHASVPAITLDSLLLENCALIKIDVEGVEHLVLGGARRTLERCSPIVYCECNSLAAGMKSVSVLEKAGYKVFAHVVKAFNADNFFNVQDNIFDNASEVALVGIPVGHEAQIRTSPVRAFELILDIDDADDLALALLNKPQYPAEVLRRGSAAKTGGAEFLNRYDTCRLELQHLQNENSNLQSIRAEERHELEQRVKRVQEELLNVVKDRDGNIAHFQALLTQRDADARRLQGLIEHGNHEIADLRALLAQRDTNIIDLEESVEQEQRTIASLRALLAQRDTNIVDLDESVEQKQRTIASLRALLIERHAEIARLRELVEERHRDLTNLRSLLMQREEDIANLYASKSWKVTKPLRWASKQIEHARGT